MDSTENSQFDLLAEHRKLVLELQHDQIKTFDKSILATSSGALAIILANIDKFRTTEQSLGTLIFLSLLAFGLSIALNITSYMTGFKDAELELRNIDYCISVSREWEKCKNNFKILTIILNFGSLMFFICGIILVSVALYTTNGKGV